MISSLKEVQQAFHEAWSLAGDGVPSPAEMSKLLSLWEDLEPFLTERGQQEVLAQIQVLWIQQRL